MNVLNGLFVFFHGEILYQPRTPILFFHELAVSLITSTFLGNF